jgi:hypothetical protein
MIHQLQGVVQKDNKLANLDDNKTANLYTGWYTKFYIHT